MGNVDWKHPYFFCRLATQPQLMISGVYCEDEIWGWNSGPPMRLV